MPGDFRRLQDALDAARPGDRILVRGGLQRGPLQAATDDVEIVGIRKARLAGRLRRPAVPALQVSGDRVVVRGFAFQRAGIEVLSDGVRVVDCTFRKFPKGGAGEAVITALGREVVVSGNSIGRSCVGRFGIQLIGDRGTVAGNGVGGRLDRAGISVRGEGCTVEGNEVEVPPGSAGIRVEGGAAAVIANRVAGADLRVYGDGARIEGNSVTDAALGQASFLLVGSGGALLGNAVTRGQDTGYLVAGDGNTVKDCSVEGNGSILGGTRVGHGFVVRGSGNLLARDTAAGCASQAFRIVGNGDIGLVEDPFTGAWYLRAVPLGPGNRIVDCAGTGAGTCGLGNGTLGTVVTGSVFSGNGIDVIAALDFEDFSGNTWTTGGPSYRGNGELSAGHDLSGSDLPGGEPGPPEGPPPPPQLHPLLPEDFAPGPAMVTGRAYHTASTLPGGDVLLAGGQALDGTPLSAAEVFDRTEVAFQAVGGLAEARRSHAATELQDGRVLACGGFGTSKGTLASVEIFDPGTRRWTPAAPMAESRARHTATLLGDGRVLVAGGYTTVSGALQFAATTEIYDPSTGRWIAGPAPVVPRGGHSATLLPDGRVLLVGGARFAARIAEVFDPVRGTIQRTAGDPAVHRVFHAAALTVDGLVLLAGGGPPQAEYFLPSTGRFYGAGSTPVFDLATTDSTYDATLTPLPGGRCVFLGGLAAAGAYDGSDLVMSSVGVWDPGAGYGYEAFFHLEFDLEVPRAAHTVTALGGGLYLIAGGLGTSASSSANEGRTTILRPGR